VTQRRSDKDALDEHGLGVRILAGKTKTVNNGTHST
jgi:hypothetical protein